MARFLVVAHKTLGGQHLIDHLVELRAHDPELRVHVLVPEYHPFSRAYSHPEVQIQARAALGSMLEHLATLGIDATGEVGESNPVPAVALVIRREGSDAFDGIILSTLPEGISRWWHLDVPKRLKASVPGVPFTHLVAESEFETSKP